MEKVRLVLKASNTSHDPELSRYLDKLEERNPRCIVLRHSMTSRELTGLIRACNCYVSPHRSEGFGLTVAEAMILGLPVIATDYGGTADFLTEEVGFPLSYDLIEVDRDYGPYAKGAIWAEPLLPHLRELMRLVVEQPQLASAKGKRARARLTQEYSAAAVGRRMRDRLAAVALPLDISPQRINA